MKTKNFRLDLEAKLYIISCIASDGYQDTPYYIDTDNAGEAEKLKFLQDTFEAEYSWHYTSGRGTYQSAFMEWCQGLPSVFNIVFCNHDILTLARQWGGLAEDASESQENKILENYWNFIANKTMQLFRKHGLNTTYSSTHRK